MIWNILTVLTLIIAVFLITFMLWISSQINEKVGPRGLPGQPGKCGKQGNKGPVGPAGGVYKSQGYIKLRPHLEAQSSSNSNNALSHQKCLSKYAIANSKPRLEKCNGDTYQYWYLTSLGQLKNKGDNKCLSLDNNNSIVFKNCIDDKQNENSLRPDAPQWEWAANGTLRTRVNGLHKCLKKKTNNTVELDDCANNDDIYWMLGNI